MSVMNSELTARNVDEYHDVENHPAYLVINPFSNQMTQYTVSRIWSGG